MKSCRYYHFLLVVMYTPDHEPSRGLRRSVKKGVLWTNMRPLQVDTRDSHLYIACWSVYNREQHFWSTKSVLDCLKLNAPSKALDNLSLYRSKVCTFLILWFSQFAGFLIAWFNLSNYNCGIILKVFEWHPRRPTRCYSILPRYQFYLASSFAIKHQQWFTLIPSSG